MTQNNESTDIIKQLLYCKRSSWFVWATLFGLGGLVTDIAGYAETSFVLILLACLLFLVGIAVERRYRNATETN